MKSGLDAPICLTWELTYACNLQCVHCLSSSGQRDPRELSTDEAKMVIDELRELQVFYINYLDIQISLDGVDAATNDSVRGAGSYDLARRAMDNLADAGFGPFKISVVVTRHNVPQLDAFKELADSYGAQLRITRLRPSGRGVDSWHDLHPTNAQQRDIYSWLLNHGENVLTGDSFFHLNALGDPLPGLNMCGAGRVVCLIDPIGDVYACPFVIHEDFRAGNVREAGGFTDVWRRSELFTSLREPQSAGACASCGSFDACQGGCMAAKFFTGLPLDGPDPECVGGDADPLLEAVSARPRPSLDHSKPVAVRLGLKPVSAL